MSTTRLEQSGESTGLRRRSRVGLAAVGLLAGVALVLGGLGLRSRLASDTAVQAAGIGSTEPVQQGRLSAVTNTTGTLTFADQRQVAAATGGTVTWLPPAGSTVTLGGRLYVIDDRATYLFDGPGPAWRGFADGMTDGYDVKQLERGLKALRVFGGTPDEKFDARTVSAIKQWQTRTGQKPTGSIAKGAIVFAPGAVRIASVDISPGAGVGPGMLLLHTSALDRVVTSDVALADQTLAVKGKTVVVVLPGGASVNGIITSVGTPESRTSGTGTSEVVPIVVSVKHQAAVDSFQRADVTVGLPSGSTQDVLYVPVSALLAVGTHGFGVQVDRGNGATAIVPVTTGLFVAGNVQVSGDGIKAGDRVVVPTT